MNSIISKFLLKIEKKLHLINDLTPHPINDKYAEDYWNNGHYITPSGRIVSIDKYNDEDVIIERDIYNCIRWDLFNVDTFFYSFTDIKNLFYI